MSSVKVLIFAVLLSLAVASAAPALESDGWRVGVQVGGTGLVSLLVEFHFSDNAICLNAGILDSFNEPDIALWYRRYIRFAGLDGTGLVPYVGAGAAVLANIHALSDPLVFLAAATGVDWNFWSTLSLCGEANLLLNVRPWPPHVTFMPALSLRAGL
ncbi:MAG: hypothetical protein A2177_15365 [Spirochaetes bacterium RBG_13_68_11]|nr:MAG: hypothetical protein A2177_15365 [Spirochaetes bacterium RBG_13_68_11]